MKMISKHKPEKINHLLIVSNINISHTVHLKLKLVESSHSLGNNDEKKKSNIRQWNI